MRFFQSILRARKNKNYIYSLVVNEDTFVSIEDIKKAVAGYFEPSFGELMLQVLSLSSFMMAL